MPRILKEVVILGLGAIAVIYLINPTAGFLEFIPDNIPLIGNLDEAGASFILLNTMAYYGFDISRLFGRPTKTAPTLYERDPQNPVS